MNRWFAVVVSISILGAARASAQAVAPEGEATPPDSVVHLQEVVVKPKQATKLKYIQGNTELVTGADLKRAACCSLGESFTTNPSVDVSYSDAATGARQIKLLGLSGTYVQMLTENLPTFRGAGLPFGLSYVPGPWLNQIQVSKGASTVKNGYESITGQINIDLKKPQADESLNVNAYTDSDRKVELNADGNLHFGDKWSSVLLLHGENSFEAHDKNDDGFADMPKTRQAAVMNRWFYRSSINLLQFGVKALAERRESGQIAKHYHYHDVSDRRYKIDIRTDRLEAFLKNAFFLDSDQNANIALMAHGAFHDQKSTYGRRLYDVINREAYAQLMFERGWTSLHRLSAGMTFSYEDFRQKYRLTADAAKPVYYEDYHESVAGAYAEYTYNLYSRFIAGIGARYDYNSKFGSIVTPRAHLRFNPSDAVSLHGSCGTGRRSPHPLVDFAYLLASSREMIVAPAGLRMERGVNAGLGGSLTLKLADRNVALSAEYYYTHLDNQTLADLDSDPHQAIITSDGRSRSNTFQAELTADIVADLTLTAAYRLTDVKVSYARDQGFVRKPLSSRSKGLFTLGWLPMMGIWQLDLTLSINGSGVMPRPYLRPDGSESWSRRFPAYCGLNFQVTRNFRHWAVYVGGENLTNYRQRNPVVGASDPWGKDFDATMVWGPLNGAMAYIGFRYNLSKF